MRRRRSAGKTLLARAIAGEAGVPFLSVAGTEFDQLFVGIGASRVRDMFRQARESAPCILFIDEFDGIGKQRSLTAANGEARDEDDSRQNKKRQRCALLAVQSRGISAGGHLGFRVTACLQSPPTR